MALAKGDEGGAIAGWGTGITDPKAAGELNDIVSNSTNLMNGTHGTAAGRGKVGGKKKPASKRGSSTKRRQSSSTAPVGKAKGKNGKLPSINKRNSAPGRRANSVSGKSSRSAKSSKSKRSKSSRGSKGSKGKKSKKGGKKRKMNFSVAVEVLEERFNEGRNAIISEEEFELDNYGPIYNVLLMEMVRTQVEQLTVRQRKLNDAITALREEGIPVADEDTVDQITEKLRQKMHNDTVEEIQTLRCENAALRDRLEDRKLELEKKVADVEVLRNTIARKMARVEVDNDTMRAQVQRVIQNANLDVEKMKKELTHRIEICCAAFRTPKYGTALRSMQDLVSQVKEEIQDHHDVLAKLIVSIGAKDTFKRDSDESETMHSNFPSKYRLELRKLNKDHLLNLMDVLSFQDGTVETVGKALYVLNEAEYQTSVV